MQTWPIPLERVMYQKRLKLFVWTKFPHDDTDTIAIAIAEDEEQAKQLVIELNGCDAPSDWGEMIVSDVDTGGI